MGAGVDHGCFGGRWLKLLGRHQTPWWGRDARVEMLQEHPRLLACDSSTDQETFPRKRMVGDWRGPFQMRAWESGVENGGMGASAV